MKLGIMQPYFLPYIGYWQLMNAVDEYVIYDDVSYIKGGWINRNQVLMNGRAHLFTLPVFKIDSYRKICDHEICGKYDTFMKTLRMCYAKAPQFDAIFPLIREICNPEERNLAKFIGEGIKRIADYLGIVTKFHYSSELNISPELRSQERVVAICKALGATEYCNAIGGEKLYQRQRFARDGIKLSFVKSGEILYRQFGKEFVPNLSIVDAMMFCSIGELHDMLNRCSLV